MGCLDENGGGGVGACTEKPGDDRGAQPQENKKSPVRSDRTKNPRHAGRGFAIPPSAYRKYAAHSNAVLAGRRFLLLFRVLRTLRFSDLALSGFPGFSVSPVFRYPGFSRRGGAGKDSAAGHLRGTLQERAHRKDAAGGVFRKRSSGVIFARGYSASARTNPTRCAV